MPLAAGLWQLAFAEYRSNRFSHPPVAIKKNLPFDVFSANI
jgi:hypothetical protein